MSEKRFTSRLLNYWKMLRKEAALPHFSQFNKGVVDDLWPNCLVFSAQPTAAGKFSFRVQDMGDNLVSIFGNNLIGRDASRPSLKALGGGKVAAFIEKAAAERQCVEMDGNFVNDRHKIIKYRVCLLPFSSAQEEVSHIIAGISWREF